MAAKPFAVGDVLPATTRLKISWLKSLETPDYFAIRTESDYYLVSCYSQNDVMYEVSIDDEWIYRYDSGGFISPYTDFGGAHAYIVINTSSWSLDKRTIAYVGDDRYFVWEDLNAPSGYTITFDSNGGTIIPDIEEATELPTLPTPTKSGYTFIAWYYESNFQTRAKAGDTIESNVTLYAKWHNLGSLFTEIANAIRSKDGTSENIRDVDFGERVKQIQGAIELTQAQYDALETKDANTYYLIVEVE